MTIFIGKLLWNTEVEDRKNLLITYGEVIKCTIPFDRDSGRKGDFGFEETINKSAEKNAIDDLNDVEWMGREIRVDEADQWDHFPRRNRLYENKKLVNNIQFFKICVKK